MCKISWFVFKRKHMYELGTLTNGDDQDCSVSHRNAEKPVKYELNWQLSLQCMWWLHVDFTGLNWRHAKTLPDFCRFLVRPFPAAFNLWKFCAELPYFSLREPWLTVYYQRPGTAPVQMKTYERALFVSARFHLKRLLSRIIRVISVEFKHCRG